MNGTYSKSIDGSSFSSLRVDSFDFDEGILEYLVTDNNQLESKRLAKCIYNGDCSSGNDFPEYVDLYGTFNVTSNTYCSYLGSTSYNRWTSIVIGDQICYGSSYTSLSITNHLYLERITTKYQSFNYARSFTLKSNSFIVHSK